VRKTTKLIDNGTRKDLPRKVLRCPLNESCWSLLFLFIFDRCKLSTACVCHFPKMDFEPTEFENRDCQPHRPARARSRAAFKVSLVVSTSMCLTFALLFLRNQHSLLTGSLLFSFMFYRSWTYKPRRLKLLNSETFCGMSLLPWWQLLCNVDP